MLISRCPSRFRFGPFRKRIFISWMRLATAEAIVESFRAIAKQPATQPECRPGQSRYVKPEFHQSLESIAKQPQPDGEFRQTVWRRRLRIAAKQNAHGDCQVRQR